MWITTNRGKFLKSWEYQTTLFASLETCVQIKKEIKKKKNRTGHGTMDWFQIGKAVHQGYITILLI